MSGVPDNDRQQEDHHGGALAKPGGLEPYPGKDEARCGEQRQRPARRAQRSAAFGNRQCAGADQREADQEPVPPPRRHRLSRAFRSIGGGHAFESFRRSRFGVSMQSYDIITVGGGLAGSALAKAMAERGARVLVVERETHFKDRV